MFVALLKAAVADGVRTRTELRSVRKDGGLSETCTGLGPPEPSGSTPRIGPSAWDARGRSELISHLEHHLSTARHRRDITLGWDAVAAVKKVTSQWPTLSESP